MVKLCLANVKLFRAEPGYLVGRYQGVCSGYRTYIVIPPSKQEYWIEFLDEMELGENENVRLQTLDHNKDCIAIDRGAEFRIVEGLRHIGLGEILW